MPTKSANVKNEKQYEALKDKGMSKERAAKIWKIDPEAVKWEEGMALPAGPNAGQFPPLSLAELAAKANEMGGPIGTQVQLNTTGADPGFATHCVDVEVDEELGIIRVLRYTAAQDVGRALHPSYVEGQIQGGVVQGIGWALSEVLVAVLAGVFDPPPAGITVPWLYLGAAAAATVGALALAAETALRRSRRPPIPVLREL